MFIFSHTALISFLPMSIPLSPNSTYSVGVLWDFVGGHPIDVDIQAIAVDNRGTAYYSFASALLFCNQNSRRLVMSKVSELSSETGDLFFFCHEKSAKNVKKSRFEMGIISSFKMYIS